MNAEKQIHKEAENNNWSHAYLFVGSNQETINRVIDFIIQSKKILKEDVVELVPLEEDAKSKEIKVSDVKRLINQISLTPLGTERLVVIRNCENLNQSSANILLKSIEEPVGKITFILISQTNSVLPTIKSRCRAYNFLMEPQLNATVLDPKEFFGSKFYQAGQMIDALAKKNQIEEFFNNVLCFYRQKLIERKEQKHVEMLRFTQQMRSDIKDNTSPKLALECLWLKAREIKSGRN